MIKHKAPISPVEAVPTPPNQKRAGNEYEVTISEIVTSSELKKAVAEKAQEIAEKYNLVLKDGEFSAPKNALNADPGINDDIETASNEFQEYQSKILETYLTALHKGSTGISPILKKEQQSKLIPLNHLLAATSIFLIGTMFGIKVERSSDEDTPTPQIYLIPTAPGQSTPHRETQPPNRDDGNQNFQARSEHFFLASLSKPPSAR